MYNEFKTIIDRIKQGKLWRFRGGVHPDGRKSLSNTHEIADIAIPNRLYLPLKQHIGVEGVVSVAVGDHVLKGQKLTKSSNPFFVPVHAPTSGKIVGIEKHVSAHPSGIPEQTIIIEPDKKDTWAELKPLKNYDAFPKIKVLETICQAGIAGMGGAGFPTHLKASPKKGVEFLIINGVECEPYITADDRLMREHANQIRQGIDILAYLLSPQHIVIAIEDNKPEAVQALTEACSDSADISVCEIPTRYPAGGEKQLIQVLTNREVPHNGLPIDVGVIMQNVGTCFAIADAVLAGIPLIRRVVTITGEAIDRAGNAWVLLGTPISHLMSQAEYHAKRQSQQRMIMGGPMMGYTVASADVPVIKTTNCILVPTDKEMPPMGEEQPCIRCSACADACPAHLLPQQLYWHGKAKEYDKAQEYNLFDCIECGACAFVCPSEIPLVHYYRQAKADIRIQQEEADKAEKARERFEARKARLKREQEEREEKHRKAAEARRQAMDKTDSDAKDKIAAALARVKAKQSGSQEEAPKTANKPNDKVAAAIARAKAKKQAASESEANVSNTQNGGESNQPPSTNDKVAAAIARAKAKKAQRAEQENTSIDTNTSDEPQTSNTASDTQTEKQDRIAQAIARAKAKKAAKQQFERAENKSSSGSSTEGQGAEASMPVIKDEVPQPTDTAPLSESEARKQRVAAAIAKAKAKKAKAKEKQALKQADNLKQEPDSPAVSIENDINQQPSAESAPADPETIKKQKVAAAVARAKARKAAKDAEKLNEQNTKDS
ncbi:electron transport complex subunit RsxC [Aestuariibacter sp. AA17]|uniref:Ion-translocating oxidoreductase complex subunit C n=1 Tax=Fluctibacter corallii TaxID=2984329 RepID=A0ABT3ABG3_9ALTE|nr:electron transport complex subunit RsxC [Aestuariibacter sp. AA17]MCV2885622.1 electron transport complex subunit RsxC [Aestuariibacter sp. AA17]